MDAGILRSAEQGKNVPMFNTKCRSAGRLSGNMVVSLKPIPALSVSKEVEITSKYTLMLTAVPSASDVPMLALKILTSPNGVRLIWSRKMSLFFTRVESLRAS
jgi:uncharacterized protein YcsI (UPF0317 family)